MVVKMVTTKKMSRSFCMDVIAVLILKPSLRRRVSPNVLYITKATLKIMY